MLIALNYFSVLIFGIMIMSFFLDIKASLKNILFISAYVLLSGLLQFVLYFAFGINFIKQSYPFVIHLPLIIFFVIFFKKRINSVVFVLLIAYTFTSPRKWIGDVISSSFFNSDPTVSIIIQIISSIVLLIVIYLYLRPFINRMLEYSGTSIILLTVMPALFYFISYAATVYTDQLYHSNILIAGLIGVGIIISIISYIFIYTNETTKVMAAQTEQAVLKMQIDATVMQMENYKKSQNEADLYRHDLRHHLKYISSCIVEKHLDEVQSYISKIICNIEETRVTQYCENTTINLLLSAYAAQAKKNNTTIDIFAVVPSGISIHAADICVILGNGIENAIHSCMKIDNVDDRKISVTCRYDDNKLMIKILNPFAGEIQFRGDTPFSAEKNHGFGVQSIKAAVLKHQGLYSFSTENNIFEMRVVLYG